MASDSQTSVSGAIPSWLTGIRATPLGYQQLSVAGTAVGLTVPTGATMAIITVSGQIVRYRDDGTVPTASVGMPLAVGSIFNYASALSAIQFIAEASTATLDILYYQ